MGIVFIDFICLFCVIGDCIYVLLVKNVVLMWAGIECAAIQCVGLICFVFVGECYLREFADLHLCYLLLGLLDFDGTVFVLFCVYWIYFVICVVLFALFAL